jgi:hypothetical protein
MEVETGYNPLLPATYDVVWTVVLLSGLVLLAVTLRLWFRDGSSARDGAVLELLAIVLVPVLGPLAYLLIRSRRRRDANG